MEICVLFINTHKDAEKTQSNMILGHTRIGTCTYDQMTSGQEVQPAVKQRNWIRK